MISGGRSGRMLQAEFEGLAGFFGGITEEKMDVEKMTKMKAADKPGVKPGVKLICLDIDGTLINSSREITAETKRAVRLAQEKGILVTLVTGRMFAGAEGPARELGILEPLIALNGACMKKLDETEALRDLPMEPRTVARILEVLLELGLKPNFYSGHTLFIADRMERYERMLTMFSDPRYRIRPIGVDYTYGDMLEEEDLAIRKGILFPEEGLRQKAWESLKKITELSVVSSSPGNIELSHKEADKGKAVLQLAGSLGVDPGEIMAIGDSENDRSMLEVAGFSVAMGNADNEIKSAARFITEDNNHDGVALAIRRHALEGLC